MRHADDHERLGYLIRGGDAAFVVCSLVPGWPSLCIAVIVNVRNWVMGLLVPTRGDDRGDERKNTQQTIPPDDGANHVPRPESSFERHTHTLKEEDAT